MQNIDHKVIIASLEEELVGLDAEKEAFLAKINLRRNTLQRMIKGHQEYLDLWSGAGSVIIEKPQERQPAVSTGEISISKNEFKNLSFIEAIKKYLDKVKTGKTAREIGDALLAGGIKTEQKGKFFYASIRTAIRLRGDKNGIVRIENRYWLAAWPQTLTESLRAGGQPIVSHVSEAFQS